MLSSSPSPDNEERHRASGCSKCITEFAKKKIAFNVISRQAFSNLSLWQIRCDQRNCTRRSHFIRDNCIFYLAKKVGCVWCCGGNAVRSFDVSLWKWAIRVKRFLDFVLLRQDLLKTCSFCRTDCKKSEFVVRKKIRWVCCLDASSCAAHFCSHVHSLQRHQYRLITARPTAIKVDASLLELWFSWSLLLFLADYTSSESIHHCHTAYCHSQAEYEVRPTFRQSNGLECCIAQCRSRPGDVRGSSSNYRSCDQRVKLKWVPYFAFGDTFEGGSSCVEAKVRSSFPRTKISRMCSYHVGSTDEGDNWTPLLQCGQESLPHSIFAKRVAMVLCSQLTSVLRRERRVRGVFRIFFWETCVHCKPLVWLVVES